MLVKLAILSFLLVSLGALAYAAAPTITSFTPSSGVVYTVVTITGANFTSPPNVFFNGTRALDIWVNYTTITAKVPAGAVSGPISITTAGGTAFSAGAFTITNTTASPPTINSFTPTSGDWYSIVTITGTNYKNASAVKFNGVPSVFILLNSNTITAKIQAGSSSGPITVTTPGGTAISSTNFLVGVGRIGIPGTNPTDGADMVWVPPTTIPFTMGCTLAEDNGIASHGETQQVTLTGYWIYKYPVTVGQYLAFLAANPNYISPDTNSHLPPWPGDYYSWANCSGWSDPKIQEMPIVDVSWNDATGYAAWAGVSLQTEAQYEYAARGPAENNYPWGGTAKATDPHDGWGQIYCANWLNSIDDKITTWPVGSFPDGVSWCGALDLAGNVLEWCQDWLGDYSSTPVTNPTGPSTGIYPVMRVGSWYYGTADEYRGAFRNYGGRRSSWGVTLGFRCVSHAPGP